jgi:VCBS repeat-containing protein
LPESGCRSGQFRVGAALQRPRPADRAHRSLVALGVGQRGSRGTLYAESLATALTLHLLRDYSLGRSSGRKFGRSEKDPKLGDLADNGGPTRTYALLAGSPAIDQGEAFGTTTDQRGKTRPFDLANVDNAPGGDGSDTGAFELNNRPPAAGAESYTTNEDTPINVSSLGGVLANDTDPDTGDALEAVLVSGPSHADSFTLNSNGSFSYAPKPNYNGDDSFTYKANDGKTDSEIATVSITVTAVNDAPGFTKGADQTVNEDAGAQSLTGWAKDISAGPSDEPTQRVSFDVTNDNNASFTSSGQPAISSDGTLTYTPAKDANGTATVTVRTTDNGSTANGGADTSAAQSDGQASSSVPVTVKAGGNGNDTLGGTSGADLLLGQNGDDTLSGAGASDVLCGVNGNDRLSGGTGPDTFDGGPGTDAATDFNATEGDSKTNIP